MFGYVWYHLVASVTIIGGILMGMEVIPARWEGQSTVIIFSGIIMLIILEMWTDLRKKKE